MMMERVDEIELCLVCCSDIKSDNNNRQLLSSNLNVFYLLRKVFKVTGIQLKNSLINCGNPAEWIQLCDKCSELTRQAEDLFGKLKCIERELNSIEQLIRDKARISVNCEVDPLAEEPSSEVWRRLRNHVATKCTKT